MNKTEKKPSSTEAELEKDITEYLRSHPDFFVHHLDLLRELRIPHNAGEAVSLVEYQVSAFRDQARQSRRQMQDLIQNARNNEELNQRLHRLTLHLIDCPVLNDILAVLEQALLEDFGADAVAIRVFASPVSEHERKLVEFVGDDSHGKVIFESVLNAKKPVCGRMKADQAEFLFGSQSEEIGSAALLQLGEPRRFGFIAITSRDAQRFHPEMGTSFLLHLSQIVTRIMSPHVSIA
jgi:uncharacterized protein